MDSQPASAAATVHNPLKRSLEQSNSNGIAEDAQMERDRYVQEQHALEQLLQGRIGGSVDPMSWAAEATTFAHTHLKDADAVGSFRHLCESILKVTVKQPPQDEQKQAPMLPVMNLPVPQLPVMPSPVATASPVGSPVASIPVAVPADLLATVSDISLLVPRGKYQLQLTSSGATFAIPATSAKSLSFPWSNVLTVFDVADGNKRDWLVVILLKKGTGVLVGKQQHHAFVIKMLATEKLKEGRVTLGAPLSSPAHAQAQSKMQTYLDSNAGEVKLNSGLVALLRSIPALQHASFVAHDPAIFTSQKQLPCVGCKLGVQDGFLYLLRTGLLFIKVGNTIMQHFTPVRVHHTSLLTVMMSVCSSPCNSSRLLISTA
jgi:hypothetical protein